MQRILFFFSHFTFLTLLYGMNRAPQSDMDSSYAVDPKFLPSDDCNSNLDVNITTQGAPHASSNFRPASPLPTPPHPPLPTNLDVSLSISTSWKAQCEVAARNVVHYASILIDEPSNSAPAPRLKEGEAKLLTS